MMKWAYILFFSVIMAACSFTPPYHRPALTIPATYKEGKVKWRPVHPGQVVANDSHWWQIYEDPILNQLEDDVSKANQDLSAAYARFQAARAELNVARAEYYPSIIGVANSFRQQVSKNTANKPNSHIFSDNLLAINLSYEVDVWGRVRNSVAAARNIAQASAEDLMAVALSLHAELANNYFALRGADASLKILNETVSAYEKAYQLTLRRYRGGASNVADVDQAKTQLETAKTAAVDMHLQRMQFEHAIATLTGRVPATFCIKPVSYQAKLVNTIPDLPSTLLERRPDIKRAESLVLAANYNIGVARSAFYPAINLSAGVGLESATLSNLISSPSSVWALGPTTASALLNNGSMPLVTQTLFDGGRIRALTDEAFAKHNEAASSYKQTVLKAFQEVEDSLVALHDLDRQHTSQMRAVRSAKKSLDQASFRYKEGLTTYLDVVVEQNIFLQAELSNVNISTRRQMASVQLIRALGGGWRYL